MPTITLKPNGPTANSGTHSNVTVAGSSPQWGDGSDSTYAEGTSASGFRADMAAPLETLALPPGVTVTGIRARVRASASGGTVALANLASGPTAVTDFTCYFTTNTGDLSDNGTYGLSGAATDFDLVEASSAGVVGDPLSVLLAGAYVGVSTSGGGEVLRVYEFTVFVDYDEDGVDLPCDTNVDMDLSAASFILDDDGQEGPFGQYSDGVIWAIPFSTDPWVASNPEFYFSGITTEAKPYTITVTFDPSSPHDAGGGTSTPGRAFWVSAVPAGGEDAALAAGTWDLGDLYDGGSNNADLVTFTVNPDAGVNFFFETDYQGAVSAIRVRKVCTTIAPPLRHYPRSDGLGASTVRRVYPPPPTIQASNRRGPSAIL